MRLRCAASEHRAARAGDDADDEQPATGLEDVARGRRRGDRPPPRRLPSRPPPHAPDGGLDAVVGHAPAQRARHRLADLRHRLAAGCDRAAPWRSGSGRSGRTRTAAPARRSTPAAADAAARSSASPSRVVISAPSTDRLWRMHERTASPLMMHRAGAALPESAAEARAAQAEIVAQHVEERRRRFDVHGVAAPVDSQRDRTHRVSPRPGARRRLRAVSTRFGGDCKPNLARVTGAARCLHPFGYDESDDAPTAPSLRRGSNAERRSTADQAASTTRGRSPLSAATGRRRHPRHAGDRLPPPPILDPPVPGSPTGPMIAG